MPELQSQLSEILRTCVHPTSLILRIVHIIDIDTKHRRYDTNEEYDESHRFTRKYFLTDGTLIMQALLNRKLSTLQATASLRVGDEFDIHKFEVRKSLKRNGTGHVAFLLIRDCHFILKSQSPVKQLKHSVHTPSPLKRKWQPEDLDSDNDIPPSAQKPRELSPTPVARIDGSSKKLADSPIALESIQLPVEDIPSDLESIIDSDFELSSVVRVSQNNVAGPGTGVKKRGDDFLHRLTPNKTPTKQIQVQYDTESEDGQFESIPTDDLTSNKRRRLLQNLTQANPDPSTEISHGQSSPLFKHGQVEQAHNLLTRGSDFVEDSRFRIADESPTISEQLIHELPIEQRLEPELPQNTVHNLQLPESYEAFDEDEPLFLRSSSIHDEDYSSMNVKLLPSPPFHTLTELRQFSQSSSSSLLSSLTTMAIVIWVSDRLFTSPDPKLPPKRLLKILDPSCFTTSSQSRNGEVVSSGLQSQVKFQGPISVEIYVDAENFNPRPGTMSLFRGLSLHHLARGDVSLSAHDDLSDKRFEDPIIQDKRPVPPPHPINDSSCESHWFITNPDRIRQLGFRSQLISYTRWWNDRKRNG